MKKYHVFLQQQIPTPEKTGGTFSEIAEGLAISLHLRSEWHPYAKLLCIPPM
jgi:hypothetical protein